MITDPILWGLVALTLASGLVAGVFLAFSDFLMKSLHAADPAAGTEAMQVINRKVYRSIFMVLFIALTPLSALASLLAALFLDGAAAFWLIAAGALYVFGVFGVTGIRNVPMNRQLDGMPLGGVAARNYWPAYVRGWIVWNHVRSLASAGAMVAYLLGALQIAATP